MKLSAFFTMVATASKDSGIPLAELVRTYDEAGAEVTMRDGSTPAERSEALTRLARAASHSCVPASELEARLAGGRS